MRFFIALFLLVLLVFFGVQAYRQHSDTQALLEREQELDAQASALRVENATFADDIEYVADDRNAAKELQSRFNYRRPDEKMYMLSPAGE